MPRSDSRPLQIQLLHGKAHKYNQFTDPCESPVDPPTPLPALTLADPSELPLPSVTPPPFSHSCTRPCEPNIGTASTSARSLSEIRGILAMARWDQGFLCPQTPPPFLPSLLFPTSHQPLSRAGSAAGIFGCNTGMETHAATTSSQYVDVNGFKVFGNGSVMAPGEPSPNHFLYQL